MNQEWNPVSEPLVCRTDASTSLAGNGRTLSLRASGSKVLVTLPMDGITTFVSRVRVANPSVAVNGF